jgi:hypothetical protein
MLLNQLKNMHIASFFLAGARDDPAGCFGSVCRIVDGRRNVLALDAESMIYKLKDLFRHMDCLLSLWLDHTNVGIELNASCRVGKEYGNAKCLLLFPVPPIERDMKKSKRFLKQGSIIAASFVQILLELCKRSKIQLMLSCITVKGLRTTHHVTYKFKQKGKLQIRSMVEHAS